MYILVFPKIGVLQNGWFVMANPITMDDLGVPLFSEKSICNQKNGSLSELPGKNSLSSKQKMVGKSFSNILKFGDESTNVVSRENHHELIYQVGGPPASRYKWS